MKQFLEKLDDKYHYMVENFITNFFAQTENKDLSINDVNLVVNNDMNKIIFSIEKKNKPIDTRCIFRGKKVYLESTGDSELDLININRFGSFFSK